ncbi:MAG: DUF1616 domain-containing protein [Candidatus Bathyarchaeota archaeon]|nr:DUF1616 domain-containing protein [Candidatus Bathyarchaeota archaeon]
MRTAVKLMALFLLVAVLLSATAIVHAQNTTVDSAQNAVNEAYAALVKADNAGADITVFSEQLNFALNLTSQAQSLLSTDPQEAQNLSSQAQIIAQNVTDHASTARSEDPLKQPLIVAVIVAALITSGVLVYHFIPNAIWKVWLRLRKNYHVKTRNGTTQNNGLVITAEQLCAVILGATIVVAFFVASPFFLPNGSGEPFSELGILGPNMNLGDYPSNIVAGDSVDLYVYVGNQMGKPMYYTVMVKLGDNGTAVDPVAVDPVQQFVSIVPRNGTWFFPVNVPLTEAGLNQRIIFELWIYNETLNQNQYHDRWGQVWLNVTAPAT